MDLNELRKLLEQTINKRRELVAAAEARDDKSFTDEERTSYDELMEQGAKLHADIKRIEDLRAAETERLKGDQSPREEKKDFGEWIYTVRFNPNDPALETRDTDPGQSMGVGVEGGFAVPNQFLPGIRQVSIDEAIFRPRASIIPAGSPPDASVTFPALDQSTSQGMYAGVEVDWIGEGITKPETEAKFREVSLTPQEVAASLFITDKLLRNAPAVGAVCQKLMRKAIIGAEEDAFLNGNGVNKPLGVLNCAALISESRDTTSNIKYDDVINMLTSFSGGTGGVWITSRTTIPQLATIQDANSNYIWQPNAREGLPNTLMGLPVVFNDQHPTLGNAGDLLLVDLDYYLIKDGSGPAIAISPHVRFRENQTCVKIFWNVDGKTWLNTPLLQRDGSTQVSPFVALAA